MGYWPSYLGVGYGDALRPYFGDSGTLLFNPLVVTASLLVPALAVAGYVWTRRWRYGPFFLLLLLVGLLVMTVGFPEGTPLRRAATFTYNHFSPVQFLRTTYKAGPLVALAVACLGGAAAGGAVEAARAPLARARGRGRRGDRRARGMADAPGPRDRRRGVVEGDPGRVDRRGARPRRGRRRHARGRAPRPAVRVLPLGRDDRPDPARAGRAPGGGAQRAALRRPPRRGHALDGGQPGAAAAPAPGRAVADARPARRGLRGGRHRRRLRAQRRDAARGGRARAGGAGARQGRPRLRAGAPVRAAARLARPHRGAARGAPLRARLGARRSCGSSRRAARRWWTARPRAWPRSPVSARGRRGRCGATRATSTEAEIRAAAARGGEVAVTDSNRRRVFVASRSRQAAGPALAAGEEPPENAAMLDPFRPRQRRADGGGVPRRAPRHRARVAPDRAVPRAAAVRRVRRRPVDVLARRPDARGRAPLGRGRPARAPRRAVHRPPPPRRRAPDAHRGGGGRPPFQGPARLEPPAGAACAAWTACA